MTLHLCTTLDGNDPDCIDIAVGDDERVGRCVVMTLPAVRKQWIEHVVRQNKDILDRLALED